MFDIAIKGFAAGLKSFFSIGTTSSGRLKDEDLDTSSQIRETWEQVGQSMREAMHTVEENSNYRRAVKNHASYDAHQNYLNDEQKRPGPQKGSTTRSGFVSRQ